MKAALAEYMKTVQANVLKGFHVPVGEQFITVYPNEAEELHSRP